MASSAAPCAIVPCGAWPRQAVSQVRPVEGGWACVDNAAGLAAPCCSAVSASRVARRRRRPPARRRRRRAARSRASTRHFRRFQQPSSTFRAWSRASSATAGSSMSALSGVPDLDARRPVTADTLFRIASMSQGVHRARHPEAARRGPAVARRAWPRPTCRSCATGAIRPAIRRGSACATCSAMPAASSPTIPGATASRSLPEAEFTAMLRAGVPFTRAPQTRLRIFQFRLCAARADRHQRLGPAVSRTISSDEIMRPLGMALDRLRHRRFAAGAARASAIAGRMTTWSREPDMAPRRVRRDGRRPDQRQRLCPLGRLPALGLAARATGRSRGRCGARPCASWRRG